MIASLKSETLFDIGAKALRGGIGIDRQQQRHIIAAFDIALINAGIGRHQAQTMLGDQYTQALARYAFAIARRISSTSRGSFPVSAANASASAEGSTPSSATRRPQGLGYDFG